MKVLMCTDLEGCAGVTSFEDQAYATGKYYEQARRLLTAEVNAAVDGLADEGVDDILVWDGHGAGGVVFEELHPAARLLHGRPMPPRSRLREVYAEYDVGMQVGQHAMAGVDPACLNHTQSSQRIEYIKLNGRLVGEIGQFASYIGALGLPHIFLSGDDAACREAEALIPGVTTTSVKRGLGRTTAISLSPARAREAIRDGVRRAIARHRETPVDPLTWEPPYTLERRYFHTTHADPYNDHPMATRLDPLTVRFEAENLLDIVYI